MSASPPCSCCDASSRRPMCPACSALWRDTMALAREVVPGVDRFDVDIPYLRPSGTLYGVKLHVPFGDGGGYAYGSTQADAMRSMLARLHTNRRPPPRITQ